MSYKLGRYPLPWRLTCGWANLAGNMPACTAKRLFENFEEAFFEKKMSILS
jgi:hypothetical protein